MYIGLIFWIIMLLWLIFGFVPGGRYHRENIDWPNEALIFILFFILGWHAFGFIVHN